MDRPFSIETFINDLSLFSTTQEGVTRFPLTPESAQARSYITETMESLGMTVFTDNAGNVRGRMSGANPERKAIVMGSHFDSVRQAGKYDGVAGIACSLSALDTIIRQGVELSYPIEIIAFEAEEGCDFKSPLMGSKAVTGMMTSQDLKNIFNTEGTDYYSQCIEQGFNPDLLPSQLYSADNTEAFIELHIEQAATLDQKKIPLGIVTAISALYRVRLVFDGQTNHAGATPMDQRQDTMVGAAEFVHSIPEILKKSGTSGGSVTCGRILCHPNRANIIPGQVTLEIDIRDTDDQSINNLLDGVISTAKTLCEQYNLGFDSSVLGSGQAVIMDDTLQNQLRNSCQRLGFPHTDIHSGAGHDAGIFGLFVPTAMLFVPSIGGYSHNPQEFTPLKDLEMGAQTLADFLIHYQS